MLVVLNNEIFNMSRYDSIKPVVSVGNYRIAFFRENEQVNYVTFSSKEERDNEWERIKSAVNEWYS